VLFNKKGVHNMAKAKKAKKTDKKAVKKTAKKTVKKKLVSKAKRPSMGLVARSSGARRASARR